MTERLDDEGHGDKEREHLFAGSMIAMAKMLHEWGVPMERAIKGLRVAYEIEGLSTNAAPQVPGNGAKADEGRDTTGTVIVNTPAGAAPVTRSAGTRIPDDDIQRLVSTAALHLRTWATSKNKDPYANTMEVALRLDALVAQLGSTPRSASVPPDAINALAELVRLKRLKERNEKDIPNKFTGHTADHWQRVREYERDKEDAWAFAKSVVDAANATNNTTDSRANKEPR